jgi:hypothetical protein
MSKEKPTIKDVEKYCSCDYGIIVCPGCNGEKESELGTCAGCDGSGIRTCGKCEGLKVNKKLFEKPKKGPFNKPMFFKTIKEGFEYFAKFNKPKQR